MTNTHRTPKHVGLDGKLRRKYGTRDETAERDQLIRAAHEGGISLRTIARVLDISVGTVSRVINQPDPDPEEES